MEYLEERKETWTYINYYINFPHIIVYITYMTLANILLTFISRKHVLWIKDTIKLTYIINSLYQQKCFSRLHLFLHIEKYFIY